MELGVQYCRFEDPAEAAEIFEKGKEEEKKEEKEKGSFQELVAFDVDDVRFFFLGNFCDVHSHLPRVIAWVQCALICAELNLIH